MQIKVSAILGIRPLIGGHREQTIVIKEDAIITDIIDELTHLYGPSIKNKIFDEKLEVNHGIALFLNGRNIFALNGLRTKIKDNDEFLIFPPVGGG